jgi:beta-glucanase (GH16 family)
VKKQSTKSYLVALCAIVAVSFSACKKDEVKNGDDKLPMESLGATKKANLKAEDPYQLIWADDFTEGLDSTKWTIVKGKENVNHELQTYTENAVYVANGYVQITAGRSKEPGQEYTSGKITTANKFSIKYGRIEARMRSPFASGLATQFNLQGVNFPSAGLPQSGQIDIMQHSNNELTTYGGIQWDNNGHAVYKGSTAASTGYRVYAVEWDAQEIRWFVDGEQYWKADIRNNINSTEEFQKPFYLNLNMVVGGDLARQPITYALPTSMVVDYVKVYQLPEPTTRSINNR